MISYLNGMKSKITNRGQITIPKELRERLGIRPGGVVEFTEEDGRIVLHRTGEQHPVDRAYGLLPSERSTDDWMAILRGPVADAEP